MEEHWKAGYADMTRTLAYPEVLQRPTSPTACSPSTSSVSPENRDTAMKTADVRAKAFAMPLNNPAYPPGPYKFYNREFIIISYRTDPELLRAWCPSRSSRSATRSTTSSSACPIRPASAITPRPAR
jgi:hypothetical protein